MIYSLYIGRFQPFHEGHKAIVQKLLDEGRNVCIALRDTPKGDSDPYTVEERTARIRAVFPDETRVKVISIPDIDQMVYGRGVGYKVREMRLPAVLENISATKIRAGEAKPEQKGTPLYIVTMVARSGSSMMMEALHKGGMDPIYSPEDDAKAPWGFYEASIPYTDDLSEKYAGRLLKVPQHKLDALPSGNYKVIFMRRNPHDILRSMESLTQGRWVDEFNMVDEGGYIGVVNARQAVLRAKGIAFMEVEYEDVLSDPLGTFKKIQAAGWPIDPEKAAAVVDPAKRDRNE